MKTVTRLVICLQNKEFILLITQTLTFKFSQSIKSIFRIQKIKNSKMNSKTLSSNPVKDPLKRKHQ